jgi:four helix bundle protein
MVNKIKEFSDLLVWQKSRDLCLNIYQTTAKFPREEIFGLTSQIKRAVVSVSSNIAEGFSRRNKKEKVQFYYIALGSLTVTKSQLLLAKDLKFLDLKDFLSITSLCVETSKLIINLIRSTIKKAAS